MCAKQRRPKWRAAVLGLAMLASANVLALVPATPAHADPACQAGGVYVLWARGSGQTIYNVEAQRFQGHVNYALNAAGLTTHGWAELGNLDGSTPAGQQVDNPSVEYPAVSVWEGWSYSNSVTIGTNELVNHLNDRYAGDGPTGSGACTNETVVLGGYSQGADVIGWALERNGGGGYVSLSQVAKAHIGFAALYGDPKNHGNSGQILGCWFPPTYRPNAPCVPNPTQGFLGARVPYAPSGFESRVGSWCDQGDGICNNQTWFPGNHGNVYRDYADGGHDWIHQSAAEIAQVAKARTFNPPQGPGVSNAVFLGTDAMGVDQGLFKNQYITSWDGRFVLILQNDCNLVIYGPRYQPIWWTGIKPGCSHLVLQQDGNWVMRSTTGAALWSNDRLGSGGTIVRIQNDGNLVERNGANQAVWSSNSQQPVGGLTYVGQDHLTPDHGIFGNQYLRSTDKRYFLLLQADGNLVLYGPGQHLLWQSATDGTGAYLFALWPNGRLELRKPDGQPAWQTSTTANPSHVVVQNDGNVVLYNTSGYPQWSTGTAGLI